MHGAEHSSCQWKSGKACEHIKPGGIDRNIPAAGNHFSAFPFYMPLLCQNRNRHVSCVQSTQNNLRALCDKKAIFRSVFIQKLRFRKSCVDIQLRCLKVHDLLYAISHQLICHLTWLPSPSFCTISWSSISCFSSDTWEIIPIILESPAMF